MYISNSTKTGTNLVNEFRFPLKALISIASNLNLHLYNKAIPAKMMCTYSFLATLPVSAGCIEVRGVCNGERRSDYCVWYPAMPKLAWFITGPG